jgi:pyridoxine 4-dehydrogenase
MPPFRQARRARSGPSADMMSTFALGQMRVRRSGYGAMQLAAPHAFGPFVPFCSLGWPRGRDNPVLTSPVVIQTAARLGITPAQVALWWLLQLAPNVLLIPGTGSVAHLRENLAAERVALDDEALCDLDSVGA